LIRVLLLGVVVGAFFWGRSILKKPGLERKSYIRKSVLLVLVVCFVLLAAMGRLGWIFAALSVVVAFIVRYIPLLLRYAPQLQRVWGVWQNKQNGASSGPTGRSSSVQGQVTTVEAYKILGVNVRATKQEIIEAHRKLILKNHPDRGGSSYLAAQINQAKDVLLNK